MRRIEQGVVALAIVLSFSLNASAERLWEGHIHFVDYRLKLFFADYGASDMNALRHVEVETGRAGKFHQAGFSFVAEDDDPCQATFTGNMRVVVDGWSAEIRKLRLVRKTSYSQTWKVHPDDVKRLVELSRHRNEE